jgi:glycosyltransferase involved in cell wall biosynthesis
MAKSPVKVTVLAPFYPPAYLGGGPARTLRALVQQAPDAFETCVITRDRDFGAPERLRVDRNRWTNFEGTSVYYASTDRPMGAIRAFLEIRRSRPDLLYVNSLFDGVMAIIPAMLWRIGFFGRSVLLLAPRGELDAGALALKSSKKAAFLTWFRAWGVHSRVVWHASAAEEQEAIRAAMGHQCRIIVRENETLLPSEPLRPIERGGHARFVFLGRVSPKKGLHIAIAAMTTLRERTTLDIWGPLEDAAYVQQCRRLADELPPHIEARFLGPVAPDRVRETLAEYDALVLPTAGENFGQVIAEALSASCPVLCSDTTPWTAQLRSGGGEVVEPNDVKSWRAVLERWTALTPHDRLSARRRAGSTYHAWRSVSKGRHIFAQAVPSQVDLA